MPGEPISDVTKLDSGRYGAAFSEHLLEQYKLYVEMADKISARRESANNYFLSINGFLVTLYSLASAALSSNKGQTWLYSIPVAGVIICVVLIFLIKSYRDLNAAKFNVIHELEQHLPVAPYSREWELAKKRKEKTYVPLTYIEPFIPCVFLLLYVLLAILALLS